MLSPINRDRSRQTNCDEICARLQVVILVFRYQLQALVHQAITFTFKYDSVVHFRVSDRPKTSLHKSAAVRLINLPSAKPQKTTQDRQKQGYQKNPVCDNPDFQKRICSTLVNSFDFLDDSVFILRFTFFLKAQTKA